MGGEGAEKKKTVIPGDSGENIEQTQILQNHHHVNELVVGPFPSLERDYGNEGD